MAGGHLEEIRRRIRDLEAECAGILQARDAAYAGHVEAEERADAAFGESCAEIEKGLDAGVCEIEARMAQASSESDP